MSTNLTAPGLPTPVERPVHLRLVPPPRPHNRWQVVAAAGAPGVPAGRLHADRAGGLPAGAPNGELDPPTPRRRPLGGDDGMSTVEYAIGTIAAAAFAALLYAVISGDTVLTALTDLVQRSLTATF